MTPAEAEAVHARLDELTGQVRDLRERAEAVARGIAWLARRAPDAPAVPPALRTPPGRR